MPDIEDLCHWIQVLTKDDAVVRTFGAIPPRLLKGLSEPARFQIPVGSISGDECCDVLLALDLSIPDCKTALECFFADIFQHVGNNSVAFITVADDMKGWQDRLNRLFSYAAGICIRAHAVLSDVNWHCWLIHRNTEILDIPPLIEGWDDAPGDIALRAVNQSAPALDYMNRLEGGTEIDVNLLDKALSIAHGEFNFECSGWTHIEIPGPEIANANLGSESQMCFMAGAISVKNSDPEVTRRVGGVGSSWRDAGFFLACEAIERASDALKPDPNLAGIAFGFSKETATYRAILEFFERYYFTRSFVTDDMLKSIDISQNAFLSKVCDTLEPVNGEKHFYVLNQSQPFHVVLAVSNHAEKGRDPVYGYGLGCNANLNKAIRKALEETVQTHLYYHARQETPSNYTRRLAFMSAQGKQCHQFWEKLDKKAYLERLKRRVQGIVYANDRSPSGSSFRIEREGLRQLLSWCAEQNISIQTETLFRSKIDGNGCTVRAFSCGLPDTTPEQARDMATQDKVPFPLRSTRVC